jgi:hypothetical protein
MVPGIRDIEIAAVVRTCEIAQPDVWGVAPQMMVSVDTGVYLEL